jgi:hypothetical protein
MSTIVTKSTCRVVVVIFIGNLSTHALDQHELSGSVLAAEPRHSAATTSIGPVNPLCTSFHPVPPHTAAAMSRFANHCGIHVEDLVNPLQALSSQRAMTRTYPENTVKVN